MRKKAYPYQNRSLKNLKGERWDDIPFFDGAYQISNFGRVKALRRWIERPRNGGFWSKEKILAPVIQTQPVSNGKRQLIRLAIAISFEREKYSIPIARLVYYLFVKKFNLTDRRLFVSCKDEDALNIHPKNLVLTNPSTVITKAYQKNHRSRDAFGNSVSSVTQYDLTGKKLRSYISLVHASKFTGIYSSTICEALKKKDGYSCGFIWKKGNDKERLSKIPTSVIKRIESKKLHNTIITQYDLHGRKIKEHVNIKAAARSVKVQANWMKLIVEGKAHSSKYFYWKLGKGPSKIDIQSMLIQQHKERKSGVFLPVTQYDLKGNKQNQYRTVAEAARSLNIPVMRIHYALKKNSGISNQFIWKIGWGKPKIKV